MAKAAKKVKKVVVKDSTLTVESTYINRGQHGVWIGGKSVKPAGKFTSNQYWFVVIDRKTLKVVFNHVQTSGTTVPAGLKPFDNDQHILAFLSYNVLTLNVPQGKLYDFLLARGGGVQLRRLAQIVHDLGCGQIINVSYTLVSVLGSDTLGFELGYRRNQIITLKLLATAVPGQGTWYTPVTLPN